MAVLESRDKAGTYTGGPRAAARRCANRCEPFPARLQYHGEAAMTWTRSDAFDRGERRKFKTQQALSGSVVNSCSIGPSPSPPGATAAKRGASSPADRAGTPPCRRHTPPTAGRGQLGEPWSASLDSFTPQLLESDTLQSQGGCDVDLGAVPAQRGAGRDDQVLPAEGLLPPGEVVGATRSRYDGSHLRQLRLIRALVEAGGLSLARVRGVLAAIGEESLALHDVLGAAHSAWSRRRRPRARSPGSGLTC
jgi:hypothetical protein